MISAIQVVLQLIFMLSVSNLSTFWGAQHFLFVCIKAESTIFQSCQDRDLVLAPRNTNKAAYKTLVHPQLEYGDPIWHPYNDTKTEMVEKVQKKTAARRTCRQWRNKSSVGDMLDELEWPTLEDLRVKSSLTFLYTIYLGTVSGPNTQLQVNTYQGIS